MKQKQARRLFHLKPHLATLLHPHPPLFFLLLSLLCFGEKRRSEEPKKEEKKKKQKWLNQNYWTVEVGRNGILNTQLYFFLSQYKKKVRRYFICLFLFSILLWMTRKTEDFFLGHEFYILWTMDYDPRIRWNLAGGRRSLKFQCVVNGEKSSFFFFCGNCKGQGFFFFFKGQGFLS